MEVGPPRFELESLAPKAKRMDQATLRALCGILEVLGCMGICYLNLLLFSKWYLSL